MIVMKKIIQVILILFITVGRVFPGGIIITNPQDGAPGSAQYMLESRSLKAEIKIKDGTATTVVDQVFYNASSARLEGWFIFPVPKGSGIKEFMMDVNGTMTRAELLDATKAKTIYEDIVRRQQDPALLEYAGADMFRVRIFPIEPRSEKRTSITITQTLTKMGDLWEYTLPISSQRKAGAQMQLMDIHATVESSSPLKTVYSPSHVITSERKGDKKTEARFTEKNHKPENDFKLYVSSTADKLGVSLLTHKEMGEDGFFFLDLNPGYLEETGEDFEKDITFIIDVSGSMAGDKIKQAKNALSFCLQKLQPGDKFEVVRFSTDAEALFGKRVLNTKENNLKAQNFVKNLQELGGTNIDEAFDLALAEKADPTRPHIVLFLTDGKPTIGQTDGDALATEIKAQSNKEARIFSVGIGHDLHTKLLEKISLETKGYHTYISPEEDIELKVADIYKKLSRPVLTDIKIKAEGDVHVSQIYPKELPDLFAGSSLTLFGRFDKPGTVKITVTGKVRGTPFSFTKGGIISSENAQHDFIPSLWATRKIGWMLEEIRLRGESDELKSEIVLLARKYGIITPYTSYLIIEDEQQQAVRRDRPMPTPRPIMFESMEEKSMAKKEYDDMKTISGSGSTRSGNELRNMNNAEAVSVANQGYNRVVADAGKSAETNSSNLNFRNASGRGFYYDGKTWNEAEPSKTTTKKIIKFGSTEYFALIQSMPETKGILSLGRNVNFTYRGVNVVVVD
jgi:Ca-activated chloride channel family protein